MPKQSKKSKPPPQRGIDKAKSKKRYAKKKERERQQIKEWKKRDGNWG
jgi:hypothetical protein